MSWTLPTGRPAVMGVINVTPDSFSDGGQYLAGDSAFARAHQMLEEGADLIDVGGESTRPGAAPVPADEELRRVLRVVERIAKAGATVSIDTSKAEVAKACLAVGAKIVNDVTALGDPRMAKVCAESRCTVCLMHMLGEPRTMQAAPMYNDVVSEVKSYLLTKTAIAEEAGIRQRDVWIDPGIGFGKTVAHNLTLIRHLDQFVVTGYPVLLGVSRKSFLGKIIGSEDDPSPVDQRMDAALAIQALAQMRGVRVIRTHDVKETVRAVKALCFVNAAD